LQLSSNILDYALNLINLSPVQLRIAKDRVRKNSQLKEYVHFDLGYEADDLAAGICQRYINSFDKIVFITDDSDWIPFVERSNCYWMGITAREPRIRTWDTCFDWVKISPMFNGSVKKKAFQFFAPSDIWRFKQIYGDTSDNLPGNEDPEVYKPYIDLFNPLIKCWEEEDFSHAIELGIGEEREILNSAQVTEKLKNIPFIIPPHYPQPKAWAS
jgi:5'-3' exonuclease